MGKVRYGIWARFAALAAAETFILGGIFGCFYPLAGIGIYAILAGLLIIAFEWPVPGIEKMGEFSNNFIVRAVAYTVLAAPGFGIAPTYAGAFFLVTTSCIYIKAHMKGESLMTLPKEGRERQPKKESAPKGGDQAAAPKETAKAKSSGKSAVVLPAAPVVRPGVPAGYGAKKRANAEENAVYAAAYAPEPAAYEQPAAAQEEYDQTYDQTYDQEYDQTYDQEYDQTYENQEYYEEGYTDDQQYHAE